jgi:aspartate 1-decarboxylase
MCRGKIHRATITHSRLDYEGSIEVDSNLMKAAGILENEMVLVANLANGNRFETYVIKGKAGSGIIGLNGAAAHLGKPGNKVIIMSVAWMTEPEAKKNQPKFVKVDAANRVAGVRAGVAKRA